MQPACVNHIECDGPARKPTLAVDLLLYLQLPLRMVHGKTKEKKKKA